IRDGHVTGVQTCALPISPALYSPLLLGGYRRSPSPSSSCPHPRLRPVARRIPRAVLREPFESKEAGVALPACLAPQAGVVAGSRSEERRVGKEWRAGGSR